MKTEQQNPEDICLCGHKRSEHFTHLRTHRLLCSGGEIVCRCAEFRPAEPAPESERCGAGLHQWEPTPALGERAFQCSVCGAKGILDIAAKRIRTQSESEQTLKGGDDLCADQPECLIQRPTKLPASNAAESEVQPADSGGKTPERDWKATFRRMLVCAHAMRTTSKAGVPLWSWVSQMTGHGSTISSEICKELGFNPGQPATHTIA